MTIIKLILEKAGAAIASVLLVILPAPSSPVAPTVAPVEVAPVKEILDGAAIDLTPQAGYVAPTVNETIDEPTPEPVTVVVQIEEPEEEDAPRASRDRDPLRDEEKETPMATKEKLFTITPQEGSPLKPRTKIDLEQLRAYVIATNPEAGRFVKQMESATQDEMVAYLKSNGFEVEISK